MAIEGLINQSVAVQDDERQPGESCVMKCAAPHEPIRPRVFQQVVCAALDRCQKNIASVTIGQESFLPLQRQTHSVDPKTPPAVRHR